MLKGSVITSGAGSQQYSPGLVGILAASLPLGQAIGIYASVAYLIVVVAALILPETKGCDLAAIR